MVVFLALFGRGLIVMLVLLLVLVLVLLVLLVLLVVSLTMSLTLRITAGVAMTLHSGRRLPLKGQANQKHECENAPPLACESIEIRDHCHIL